MDELLDELGVSYNDLYKVHTGHYINNGSDDSESSDDTDSLDEDLKPPPYSVEEVNQNVSYDAKKHTENIGRSSIDSTIEAISTELSLLLSSRYCYVCMKTSRRHYKHSRHYKKVRVWLQKQLADISIEVKLNNIFCEICNKALCGNDVAKNHYQSRNHTNKAKTFCLPCLRSIPEKDMPQHLKSKKHKSNALENSSLLLMTNLNINENMEGIQISNRRRISDTEEESLQDVLDTNNENFPGATDTKNEQILDNQRLFVNASSGKNALDDLSNLDKYKTDYETLAIDIMDLLTPSVCFVCNLEVTGTHYNTWEHNQALELWIESYAKINGLYLKDMNELICFACHAIFPNKKYAEIHYMSNGHLSKSRNFCNVCLHFVVNKTEDHDQQPEHKALEAKKVEKERQCNNNTAEKHTINPVYSELMVTHKGSSGLTIHGIEINIIKAMIKDKTDEVAYCDPIVKSVIQLMTPTYCFICNKSALKNNKGHFRHYTYVTHQTELKKFLQSKIEIADLDQNDYESGYCEACNEIFLNNKLAVLHYNTPEHEGNYDIYITSHKKECGLTNIKKQSDCLIKPDSKIIKPVSHPTLDLEIINKENLPKDEPGSIIAEKLKNMLSPIFCFICKKNVNMHIFNHHYLEREHTIKLRNWLDNEINKSKVKINKNILYCEDCSLELGGTSDDLKHYETVGHHFNVSRYCSVCVFRGEPNDVLQHLSTKQHQNNSKKLLNSNKKENFQRNSWPKSLAKLITLSECKVCSIKLETPEKANLHYCSERHNINIKNWLDYYNRFGDNAVNINLNTFSCTFCDSSFDSEQELNYHKNSHFPALGGTNGRRSGEMSSTKTNKRKVPSEYQKLLEEITDKPIMSTPSQQPASQSVPLVEQPHEINSNKNEKYTKCYEEIRIEIKKLINAVYFLKSLPLEQSLTHLKKLNQKLATFKSSNIQDESVVGNFEKRCSNNEIINRNIKKTNDIALNKPSTSSKEENLELEFLNIIPNRVTQVTEQEYARTKLSMEVHRLKIVVGNKDKIPPHLAFKLIENLNLLLEDLVNGGFREFDINYIFEDSENEFLNLSKTATTHGNLQNEVDKLSDTLLNDKKISVEVALDFITQFNVQLESFLQYQDGYDTLHFSLPDYLE